MGILLEVVWYGLKVGNKLERKRDKEIGKERELNTFEKERERLNEKDKGHK